MGTFFVKKNIVRLKKTFSTLFENRYLKQKTGKTSFYAFDFKYSKHPERSVNYFCKIRDLFFVELTSSSVFSFFKRPPSHSRSQTHIYSNTHAHTLTSTHLLTLTFTHTHTHKHTNTKIYIQLFVCLSLLLFHSVLLSVFISAYLSVKK